MPAAEGTIWTYTVRTEQGTDVQVDTVTNPEGHHDSFVVESVGAGSEHKIGWSCRSDGLFSALGTFRAFGVLEALPEMLSSVSSDGVSLPRDIHLGDSWSSEQFAVGTNLQSRVILTIDYQAVGMETITVPAGEFDALRVDSVMTWSNMKLDGLPHGAEIRYPVTDWFAPGVGLVKSSAQGDFAGYDLELKSYALP